jgi:thiosulfate/3-mercaptopyruvate sulfurtransferase
MTTPPPGRSPHLASTDWLAGRLGDPGLAIVDASWYLPAQARDAAQEFLDGHIPGAVFFDIDKIADASTSLPHMLPDDAGFAATAGALGLSPDKTIVVYDGAGLFSAPRVWWMLRAYGARHVVVLDGGFPAWSREARPVESGPARPVPATFQARLDRRQVATLDDVAAALSTGSAGLVDARPAERFRGEAPEPRPGVRPGHIPGSRNLPFARVVENGRLAAPDAIADAFTQAGVDLDRPMITSCGSGVSAAILALALETIGRPAQAIYDGSWSEWGSRSDKPAATGPA